jgi:hypothetical protein
MQSIDDLDSAFNALTDLTVQQRASIKNRLSFLLREYRSRACCYAALFYLARLTITVGSLAVPALLSINLKADTDPFLYWFTWSISLAVTTSNGILTLFKIDKRFFSLHATMERLRSETWQYLQLSGRYSGILGSSHHRPTHRNQYVYFCTQIERIRMKHIDDEFVKQAEMEESNVKVQHRPAIEDKRDVDVPTPADQITLIMTPSVREKSETLEGGNERPENNKESGSQQSQSQQQNQSQQSQQS